jgi:hypothetical protein
MWRAQYGDRLLEEVKARVKELKKVLALDNKTILIFCIVHGSAMTESKK